MSCGGPAGEGEKARRRDGICARLSGMLGTPGSWQREGGGAVQAGRIKQKAQGMEEQQVIR